MDHAQERTPSCLEPRRLASRTLACAAASALCALVGQALFAQQSFHVAINEVHYHPADESRDGEFVEVHNFGTEPADLGGWRLSGGILFTFPVGSVVPAGGFAVVAASRPGLEGRYGAIPGLAAAEYSGSLDNSGDALRLFDPRGVLVSSVEYSDADPWPDAADGLGPSLERVSPGREDADASAWAASIVSGGTPGEKNSAFFAASGSTGGGTIRLDLVIRGASWRFLRGRAEPAAAWPNLGFDDATWEVGPAGFGYDRGDYTTALNDMQGSYTSIYIRREFTVADPSRIESLTLNTSIDDGYVAYINGAEVDRFNAPGPPGSRPPFDALATDSVRVASSRDADLSASAGVLVAGTNVLALQAFNAAIDSRDFTIHPSLSGAVPSGPSRSETIVPAGAAWRFFRGSSAPPSTWRELNFADEAWENGAAGFGYADNDDATVLDDMAGSYLTVFIRHRFQITGLERLSELVLEIDYDDGFIAFINGREVARANVDAPGFDQPANATHEAGAAERFAITLDPGLLTEGSNILAIEGHNQDLASTDFSLAPALDASVLDDDPGKEPPDVLVRHPRDVVVNEVAPLGPSTGWVELYNRTSLPVSAGGRRLVRFAAAPNVEAELVLPAGTTIAPRAWLVLGESELGFELDGATAVTLIAEDGRFVDAIAPPIAPPPGHSFGRFPDGAENALVARSPSRGLANTVVLNSSIVIHEIMYHASDADLAGEWIELFNRSESAVNLAGWSFTRGISYTFPAGASIAPRGYAVLARDPAATARAHGLSGVFGPWTGALRNDAETLLLRDELANPVNRVRYADEGSWTETTDGNGPSLELVHPNLDNRAGAAWASGPNGGTPGRANASFAADPAPVISRVEHSPVVPAPADTVRVLAAVSDELGLGSVSLMYERDGAGGGGPMTVPMVDDGVNDDGVAGNSVWGAAIPPQPNLAIVAFWIDASSATGQRTVIPAGAPQRAHLYQVEAREEGRSRSLYRLVLRAADLALLRSRDRFSDVLLNTTFIAGDEAFHNRGLRYRGSSARSCNPISYRVQFDHDVSFHGIKRLNINGCNVIRQFIGLDLLGRTDIPAPQMWLCYLALNGQVQGDVFLRVENVDDAFLSRTLEGNDAGNLYRGVNQANLDYRGQDAGQYRGDYSKRTNEEADDYSDVADLCFRFDAQTTSDDDFPDLLEERVDIDEWALYFAAFAVLASTENSIVLNNGDDYFLYHRPADDRWMLLPWDLDSCFDEPNQVLFRPTVDAIERFLEHPRYAPIYWCHLEDLTARAFDAELMDARIDQLVPFFPTGTVGQLRNSVRARRAYIEARLHREITVEVVSGATVCDGVLHRSSADLRLRGTAPSCGVTDVRVDGIPALFDPLTGAWTATKSGPGGRTLAVTTHYRDGAELSRVELAVISAAVLEAVPETVAGRLTLRRDLGPYHVARDVLVATGATLSVEPGVTVYVAPSAGILVAGTLEVLGTAAEPVVFLSESCNGTWGGIAFLATSRDCRIVHAELRGVTQVPGSTAALWVLGSRARIESTLIDARGATALLVERGGHVDADGVVIQGAAGAADGVVLNDATSTLVNSVLRGFQNGAILASGAAAHEVRLTNVEVSGGADGVQSIGAPLFLHECRLHDLSRTAVSSEDARVEVEATLIWSSGTAFAFGSGARGALRHVTVHGAARGISVSPAVPERPAVVAVESSIVWETPQAAVAALGSELTVAFSNIAGGVLPGAGNISSDPLFADAAAFDFRLSTLSPCRGTGLGNTDMGAISFEAPPEMHSFRRCDANADGTNNLTDAVFTLLYLFAGPAGRVPSCLVAADCDSDGRITLTDAVFDLRFLFLGGPPPAAPYPACDATVPAECLSSQAACAL